MGRGRGGPNDATTRLSGLVAAGFCLVRNAGRPGVYRREGHIRSLVRRLPWGGRKRRGSRSRDDAAPAARFLDRQVPDPVDPERMLPTDEDLIAVILDGMPGTAMPGWRDHFGEGEFRELIDYLKSFSPFFESQPPPSR